MAETQELVTPKEREIPVFAVMKNNCILKNIFLLDSPHTVSSSASISVEEDADQQSQVEETLEVGRHPDCNIKLEHPSISRFHLRIHSKPSSRSLFVTDLSSVHGTRISGKRIEPGVRTKLNEGDTLQLGASTRFYKLNWVPLSYAYDIDKPFAPQKGACETVEEQEIEGAIDQDENILSTRDDQVQTLCENMEGLELLFSDKDTGSSMQKTSPTALPMSQDLCDSFSNAEGVENSSSPRTNNQEIQNSSGKLYDFEEENGTLRAYSPSAVSQTVSQVETTETSVMYSGKRRGPSVWSRRGKPQSVHIEISQSRGKCARINSIGKDYFGSPDNEEQISTSDRENSSPSSLLVRSLKSKGEEIAKGESILRIPTYNVNQDEEEIFTPDKENMTPNSHLHRSIKNIGKLEVKHPVSYGSSPLKSKISSVDLDEEEIFTPDKENMTPNSHLLRSIKKSIDKLEEVKHPMSYKSSALKTANNSNMYQEEAMLPTVDKESQHRSVLQERKSTNFTLNSHCKSKKQLAILKATADRDPFCPLLLKSDHSEKNSSKSSVCELNAKRSGCISYTEYEENKTMKAENNRWIIVVDTACLLNKSRKELQLLRGLRGTTLVIPRIVVRELDCMLRRGSFFKRTTEVSAALHWIEECMAVAKWWIHVQSSSEEGILIPPTPPASPHWFSEDMGGAFPVGSIPFSPYSLQEIVTPTATDHILECALFFKRTRNDGQLVLLSDDVTLKIKAMAEGVICETAEEFRRSLVNPFSERFLYSDSSPIGPCWSCVDDLVLKEKYYPSPSKKLTKSGEGVKGLKLILLHNSNFRQIKPVS